MSGDNTAAHRRADRVAQVECADVHRRTEVRRNQRSLRTVENTNLGRHGTPEEMANVHAFLASGEASYGFEFIGAASPFHQLL